MNPIRIARSRVVKYAMFRCRNRDTTHTNRAVRVVQDDHLGWLEDEALVGSPCAATRPLPEAVILGDSDVGRVRGGRGTVRGIQFVGFLSFPVPCVFKRSDVVTPGENRGPSYERD